MNVLLGWHGHCNPAVAAVKGTLLTILSGPSAELILRHSKGPIGRLNTLLLELNVW